MSAFTLSFDKGVALATLNRPERRNALDAAAMDELVQMCRDIEQAKDVHVVILTGAGDTFCAGGDIAAWRSQSPGDFARHWVRDGHAALDALARLVQPVIAVLNGHALGGGLELAACADYRIAEAHVKLGQPETGLGVIAGWSGTQRATRRFGSQAVRRMALFGEVFGAETARDLGIVDQVVPSGGGKSAAQKLADRLQHLAPGATTLTKMLINAAEGEDRGRVLEALAGQIAAADPELLDGLAAFDRKSRHRFWP